MKKTAFIVFNILLIGAIAAVVIYSVTRRADSNGQAEEAGPGKLDTAKIEKNTELVVNYLTALNESAKPLNPDAEDQKKMADEIKANLIESARENPDVFIQILKLVKRYEIRETVFQLLKETGSAESLEKLAHYYPEADRVFKLKIILSTSSFPADEALEFLAEVLKNEKDIAARMAAVKSVSNFEKEKAFRLLLDTAQRGENLSIKRMAIAALGKFNNPEVTGFLKNTAFDAPEPGLRSKALIQYAEKNSPEILDTLVEALACEKDVEVKLTVIRLFGEKGRKKKYKDRVRDILEEYLDFEQDPTLKRETGRQLKSLLRNDP